MTTFSELLNQTALSTLEPHQQLAISKQQDQLLENSLSQVRRKIAELKAAIHTQEIALNPALELKDSLAIQQQMEKEIWVEIQMRKLSTAMPPVTKTLVMIKEQETFVLGK